MSRRIVIEPIAREIYNAHGTAKTPAWAAASPAIRAFVLAQARAAALEAVRQFRAMGEDAELSE